MRASGASWLRGRTCEAASGGAPSAVVLELERDLRGVGLQVRDHGLEVVLLGAADAEGFALDAGVDLDLQLLDLLLDRLGRVLVDAVLELDLLADGLVGGLFDLL